MAAPALRPLTSRVTLSESLPESVQLFSVQRGGEFAGRTWAAGELAIVDGLAQDGEAVVLVALGPGRPRLGRRQGHQLVGDRGEPCLASRWVSAGRLMGVARSVGSSYAVERFDAPGLVEVIVPGPVAAPSVTQLSLFAA